MDRRRFIKEAAVLSAGLTQAGRAVGSSAEKPLPANPIETRKIGKHNISRLIIGGNPFSGGAHAEPLVYAGELFKNYFTREKVAETLAIAEANGINTFLGRIDERIIGMLRFYEKQSGHMIPWLAQTAAKPQRGATREQILDNIKLAVDNGATGVYFQGESADYLVRNNRLDEIGEYLDFIRSLGVLAGAGAHEIETIEAIEKAGFQPDFYMKTFNRIEYNCPNFNRVKEVMPTVKAPWIAFKVLAAGRMKPDEGFREALDAGADFLCVGMFDFQVERNAQLFRTLI